MNVGGINSLGFFPQAKPVSGKASEKEADTSFSDLLGQTSSEDTDTLDVQAEDPSSQSIPMTPTAPTLDGPLPGDRNLGQKNPFLMAPSAKEPQAATQDEAINSLTKRVVWNDFLRKMKDELGVSADDVLNAFTSLSEEDLAKPPTETVDKVVMALGLDGQQAAMAKKYFSELIQKTHPKSLGEELASSEKQISLTLMSQRELDRKNTQRSVDRMQESFFMKGAYSRPQDPASAPAVATAGGSAAAMNMPTIASSTPSTAMPAAPGAGSSQPISETEYQDMEMPTAAPVPSENRSAVVNPKAKKINDAVSQMQMPATTEKEVKTADVDSLVKKFTTGQAQSAMTQQASAAPVTMAPAEPTVVPQMAAAPAAESSANQAQAAMNAILAKAMKGGAHLDSSSSEDNDNSTDASYLGATLAHDNGRLGQTQAPSEFQSQLAAQGPNAQPMAVPDLVQNAKVMVRDGGGEMKVTLKPEGLGEVAMKVSVHEGKVNVQMITESDEAKRLIERQLGELKASLTGQNLHVDAIKVDTATNLGKQMEQQYQDAQRQMAQQTLEQFRQDHQGWRRSFFEVPGAKVYKDQSEAPRDVRGPSASSARRNSNRRLDLVA